DRVHHSLEGVVQRREGGDEGVAQECEATDGHQRAHLEAVAQQPADEEDEAIQHEPERALDKQGIGEIAQRFHGPLHYLTGDLLIEAALDGYADQQDEGGGEGELTELEAADKAPIGDGQQQRGRPRYKLADERDSCIAYDAAKSVHLP